MSKAILAVALSLTALSVYAQCRTSTIITPDGRMIVCTTCCDQWGNCNSTCF